MKDGKEEADKVVENAIYKNATGFKYIDKIVSTKKIIEYDENGKKSKEIVEPVIIEVEKYKCAELGASIFWLTNRNPNKWKNTQNIKHEGTMGIAQLPDMSKMNKEELLKLIKLGDDHDKNIQ